MEIETRESPVEGANMTQETPTPIFKNGIIYLSYIPDGLTVKILRHIMSGFGEVGRIYLEPEDSNKTSKRKRYVEGWVEFKKKRIAKQVAKDLNGTELAYGRKHSILSGQIWSIKYLHKFKWSHLTQQLAMDRETREFKKRSELMRSKEQADFYRNLTERSRMMKKKVSKLEDDEQIDSKIRNRINTLKTKQNKPIDHGGELSVPVDEDLLSSIFKKVS